MPIFMKYDGIVGPLTGKYQGWIELMSCQLGLNPRISPSPTPGNVPNDVQVVVTKTTDNSSGQLFKEAVSGTPKKVTIDFLTTNKGENFAFLSFELERTVISSFSISGGGRQLSLESISLNSSKITATPKTTKVSNLSETVIERLTWEPVISW